jgi:hypothetical protein
VTAILIIVALLALAAMLIVGSRTFRIAKVRQPSKTPVGSAPPEPATYFERYMPKQTFGQGDAL